MYYLLTASFKSQETKLAELICSIPAVEKIYLLGSTLLQRRTETVFMPDAPSCKKVGHYQVLVLISKNCSLQLHDVQDRIENTCHSFIPVTAIVMQLDLFMEWLQAGKTFATTIIERSVLLYNNDNMPLLLPQPLPAATNKEDSFLIRQKEMVAAFIAGAELYIQHKQNYLAMFMLHQAVEQALHVLLKKRMYWYINTHNIDKLLRYATMVCYQLPDIFNRDNAVEEALLKQLQEAYSGSRYKADYHTDASSVIRILEKVKYLQQLVNA